MCLALSWWPGTICLVQSYYRFDTTWHSFAPAMARGTRACILFMCTLLSIGIPLQVHCSQIVTYLVRRYSWKPIKTGLYTNFKHTSAIKCQPELCLSRRWLGAELTWLMLRDVFSHTLSWTWRMLFLFCCLKGSLFVGVVTCLCVHAWCIWEGGERRDLWKTWLFSGLLSAVFHYGVLTLFTNIWWGRA